MQSSNKTFIITNQALHCDWNINVAMSRSFGRIVVIHPFVAVCLLSTWHRQLESIKRALPQTGHNVPCFAIIISFPFSDVFCLFAACHRVLHTKCLPHRDENECESKGQNDQQFVISSIVAQLSSLIEYAKASCNGSAIEQIKPMLIWGTHRAAAKWAMARTQRQRTGPHHSFR